MGGIARRFAWIGVAALAVGGVASAQEGGAEPPEPSPAAEASAPAAPGPSSDRAAVEGKPPDGKARMGGLKGLKERYPGAEENEFDQYPMGLGVERQPLRLWLLPVVSYTTDLGPMYGMLATWKVTDADSGPTQGVRIAGFWSAKDAAQLRLQWERTPGPAGVHLFTEAHYGLVTYTPYFGIGNTVDPTPPTVSGLSAEDQALVDPFYTLLTSQTGSLSVVAQKGLGDPHKRVFAAARLRDFEIRPFDGARILEETGVDPGAGYESLVVEEHPFGLSGGFAPMLQLGAMSDSRKVNIAPASGAFHEVSLRGMVYLPTDPTHEAQGLSTYAGVNVTLRRYVRLLGNWVLASRLVGDATFGDVPVFDLATFGAISPYTGLGGTLAGRGLYLNHFVGKVKILWGPELRYTPITRATQSGTMELSLAVFADSGRVWADWAPDGEGAGLHTGVGAGVRLLWSKRIMLRLDVAKALQDDDPLGVYLVFGHPY